MPTTIYVTLRPVEAEALRDLARKEDRDPRRQAARFIRDGLERAGVLRDDGQPAAEARR
jgi:hypothetical protein